MCKYIIFRIITKRITQIHSCTDPTVTVVGNRKVEREQMPYDSFAIRMGFPYFAPYIWHFGIEYEYVSLIVSPHPCRIRPRSAVSCALCVPRMEYIRLQLETLEGAPSLITWPADAYTALSYLTAVSFRSSNSRRMAETSWRPLTWS